jgi:uncharacterized iron-regulated protein
MGFIVLLILAAQSVPAPSTTQNYVPERVYDTRRSAFADFEVMLADLAGADVVLVGEQHDDSNTHRLEHAILEGLRRRRVAVTVSLEMFERDVQDRMDKYLSGSISEAEFLKDSRPWPRYATDYRPLVELARAQGWPVVASNVPRRHAAAVAKSGKAALDDLSPSDRALVAREIECPQDAYFQRFTAAMGNHAGGSNSKAADSATNREKAKPADAAAAERYYWSQCVKDETMAESIANAAARRSGQQGTIVHFTGAFHSDFGAGTAERARRRLTGRRVAVITILPVTDIDALTPTGDDLKRADYLVYTVK